MIEAKKVNFAYSDSFSLKNISLKVEKGKILGIIGHSGSGKTTLLNSLTRLKLPTSKIPGTTPNPTENSYSSNKHKCKIYDMPGLFSDKMLYNLVEKPEYGLVIHSLKQQLDSIVNYGTMLKSKITSTGNIQAQPKPRSILKSNVVIDSCLFLDLTYTGFSVDLSVYDLTGRKLQEKIHPEPSV